LLLISRDELPTVFIWDQPRCSKQQHGEQLWNGLQAIKQCLVSLFGGVIDRDHDVDFTDGEEERDEEEDVLAVFVADGFTVLVATLQAFPKIKHTTKDQHPSNGHEHDRADEAEGLSETDGVRVGRVYVDRADDTERHCAYEDEMYEMDVSGQSAEKVVVWATACCFSVESN
jgi:hypothetical protein